MGSRIGGRVTNTRLRRGFAGFLVVMGVFILGSNLPTVMAPHTSAQAVEQR